MLFGERPAISPPFRSIKFEFLVKQFATFLIGFFVSFFNMEFNPLPDLLNIRFTNIEIGLFYGGEHLGAKICRFLNRFDKITSRWRFLVGTKSGMTTCENIELTSQRTC